VWKALAGLIVLLAAAVVGLDQWQVRRGETSLIGMGWAARKPAALTPSAPARPLPLVEPPPAGGPRIAVIVDGLGGRRDVLDLLRDLRRPVALAVLPGLPFSQAMAREAGRLGMEVLLDLPMEPYRYPEVDPGPGTLLMKMEPRELGKRVAEHLDALPGAVGVANYMGSRLTENRPRMRAVAEVLAARRLFLVDAYTSSLSVAYDEARELGLRAARRHFLVDHGPGEDAARSRLDEVAPWAERRGEAVLIVRGHPVTARLLKEYIQRWETRGLRLVPVSHIAR
jgi:polysaccharide deacetylase 2 family uncharacterized protein YibQ